ncbi:unnamed protein product [Notodromas monacha]|uniref:Transmembrane protein n=1 Tax=Notodromas monacha TaxID=399045 RepID=A0A7R9BWK3_9CRUS|nr:unnamed protein product [Notodromas monacha]CAG0921925.1 unnamed protein product [Notodromas monacha]
MNGTKAGYLFKDHGEEIVIIMKMLVVFAFVCLVALTSATKPQPTVEEAIEMLDTWADCLTCVGLECALSCGFSCASGNIIGCVDCVYNDCYDCWIRCDELIGMQQKFL